MGKQLPIVFFWLASLACLPNQVLAWFDCYWPYRSQITVTEQSGTPLNNYQLEINLTSSSLHNNYNWSSSGDDIRIIDSDDSTELGFFIESWDSLTQTARIWMKVDLAAHQTKTFYIYYGNPDASNASNASLTFTEPGIKFHTRNSTANPSNKAAAFNAFDNAVDGIAGYGCTIVTNFTNIRNQTTFSPPSIPRNFGAYSETFFEVKSGESGTWGFRYGADFGRGGGLYVDGIALQERWNDDLWWAYNWNNTNEILQGTINLSPGYHKLEILGFEGCCDGGITVQFQKPGDTFRSYSEANINVVSRQCPVTDPLIALSNATLEPPSITINKSSAVISNPVQGTNNPKRIPGATVRYTLTVSNTGNAVDANSVNIDDPIPTNVKALIDSSNIGFVDGTTSSGLGFSYSPSSATDAVSFSNNNASSFNYSPVADADNADSSITHLIFRPSGRFGCTNDTSATSFSIFYDVLID